MNSSSDSFQLFMRGSLCVRLSLRGSEAQANEEKRRTLTAERRNEIKIRAKRKREWNVMFLRGRNKRAIKCTVLSVTIFYFCPFFRFLYSALAHLPVSSALLRRSRRFYWGKWKSVVFIAPIFSVYFYSISPPTTSCDFPSIAQFVDKVSCRLRRAQLEKLKS